MLWNGGNAIFLEQPKDNNLISCCLSHVSCAVTAFWELFPQHLYVTVVLIKFRTQVQPLAAPRPLLLLQSVDHGSGCYPVMKEFIFKD